MKPLLFVDGYNIIGAWGQAHKENWPLDISRDKLAHLLEDYAGYTGQEVWLVYDGYKAERPTRSVDKRSQITIVYTKHGETADQFIERMCHEMPKYRQARVATSDATEQTVILGRGATRLSARELLGELQQERSRGYQHQKPIVKHPDTSMRNALTSEQFAILEQLRRQK